MYHVDDQEAAESDPVEVKPQPTKHPSTSDDLQGQTNGTTDRPEPPKTRRPVTVEEVEDEAFIAQRRKPKSPRHLLVSIDDEDNSSEKQPGENRSAPSEQKEVHHTSMMESDNHQPPPISLPPPHQTPSQLVFIRSAKRNLVCRR